MEDEGEDRPGGGVEAVGLGQDVDEAGGLVSEVSRGEDEENPAALLDGGLELEEAGAAGGEGGSGAGADAGLGQGVEQVALDPGPVGRGVGDEQVVGGRLGHPTVPGQHSGPMEGAFERRNLLR